VDPVPVVACEWRAVGPLWLGCSVQLIQVALPAFVLAPIHLTEMEEHVNFIKKKYTYLIYFYYRACGKLEKYLEEPKVPLILGSNQIREHRYFVH
jgi:hypothetical protein